MRSEGLVISTHPPLSKMERKKRRFLLFQGFDGLMCFRALCLFSGFITLIQESPPKKCKNPLQLPTSSDPSDPPTANHNSSDQTPKAVELCKACRGCWHQLPCRAVTTHPRSVMWWLGEKPRVAWFGLYPSNFSDHLNISITKEMGPWYISSTSFPIHL